MKNGYSKKILPISESEYNSLILQASREGKRLPTISKERIFFSYNEEYFYLDLFKFSQEYAILEINCIKGKEEIKVPDFITVIKDVTNDNNFMNYNLAKTKHFII